MASCKKKHCIDAPQEKDFSNYPKKLIKQLAEALQNVITLGQPQLIPLKIRNCNAADGRQGIPFSKVYCSTDESNDIFFFGELFQRGVDILMDFIGQKELPVNKQERYILTKLLCYLEKDGHFPIKDIAIYNETELTTLLTNHLFGQLATSSHYIIDKNWAGQRKKDQCVCGQQDCKLTGSFGDTSIGNNEVWHGKLDIIINNDLVIKSVEEDDSSGEKSTIEVKLKSTELSKNPQLIAETIVFSFLQKCRHPERNHFLFPCIGVGKSGQVILLYDSQNDVLLESRPIPLLNSVTSEGDVHIEEVNLTTVLISWLVVNHKYLCTGLTEPMKTYTADFFAHAEDKIQVYEEKLHFGDVSDSFIFEKKVELNFRRGKFTCERSKKMSDILYRLYENDDRNSSTSQE